MNKTALALAVSAALAVPLAAQAVKYSLSGAVTQAVYLIDAGQDSDIQFAGLGATSSNFRFGGSEALENGNEVGMYYRIRYRLSPPADLDSYPTAGQLIFRHAEGYISGNWGKVTLGHLRDANGGAPFADQGGNSWVAFEASCDHATATAFRNAATGAIVQDNTAAVSAGTVDVLNTDNITTAITITPAVPASTSNTIAAFDICPSFDGGRSAGVRYDTPTFGGIVSGKFSFHNNSKWALQVNASGEQNGIAYSANYGYGDNGGADDASGTWVASASAKLPGGTSLTLMYGEAEQGGTRQDEEGYVIKVAHQLDPSTSVVAGYRASENSAYSVDYCNNNGQCGGSSWGVGAVRDMGGGATFGVGWQHYELDDVKSGAAWEVEAINTFYLGTIFNFN